jgi:hypothetical protein
MQSIPASGGTHGRSFHAAINAIGEAKKDRLSLKGRAGRRDNYYGRGTASDEAAALDATTRVRILSRMPNGDERSNPLPSRLAILAALRAGVAIGFVESLAFLVRLPRLSLNDSNQIYGGVWRHHCPSPSLKALSVDPRSLP